MRRSLRLTPKVALAFALFATALLVVVGILAFANGRDALEAATFADLLSSAIEKEAAFERWIATGQMYLTTLAESPFIQAQVAALHNRATPDDTIIFRENLVAELTPRTGSGRLFANLMILHPESGQVIAATDASELGTFKEDRLYFVNGKNTSYVQNVHFALECECPAITASVPLQSSDGALLGVLAGQLNLEEMEIIINRSSGVNQSADAYLVNTANILVTQPRGIEDAVVLQRGIRTQATELCLAGNSGSIMSNDYRGVPVMSVYRWLPNRELCLVVNVDQAEALSPVSEFGRTLLAISLVTLFIASVIAVALARTITRPIVALTESVVRFGRGDTRIRFSERTDDELGALGHEFNTMADAIVEKENLLQNHAKELEQRVAERTAQLTFLANASQVLSESFEYADRLKKVAQLAVPEFADWCSVDILGDDGRLERLAVVHMDPEKVALAYDLQRRFPPDPNASSGLYHVVHTGESEFTPEITDDMLAASIPEPERLALVRELGLQSTMSVPLTAHGRTMGVLTLVMAESGRRFDRDDLSLAQDLARRAGLLIDNAKLYHETQQLNTELEQRVTERTAHLTAVNRELEAFSYSVSHDLRAPLRAVDGFSQALLEDYYDQFDEMGRDFLQRIRTESQRMGQLIDDLIGLSRYTRTPINLEDVDLSQIARDIAADLQAKEPERTVEISIQSDLTACADPGLMRVVLQNLIANAWKFTAKAAQARIDIGRTTEAENAEFYVRDNGSGFDMAYVHKLFGAFQRLHAMDEFTGTGIGLATVQRIIHRHGGAIRAEGAINEGAAFYFTLDSNKNS